MKQHISKTETVPLGASGHRLDQVVANLFPEYSRARLQSWIKDGGLTLDGGPAQPKTKVKGGETVALEVHLVSDDVWLPEDLPLSVIYQDEQILVLDKPDDLVVHPAAGNYQGTLLNGLLYHFPDLHCLPRAGIVHRLDKDTTGVMVVAKTLEACTSLVTQLQARTVSREYIAVVCGHCPAEGKIETSIGRDPKLRKLMAAGVHNGKEAITHFRLMCRLGPLSLVSLKLETGRTHQIRVHMASLGYPLIGDQSYGKKLPKSVVAQLPEGSSALDFSRQALHARRLQLVHPVSGRLCTYHAELPDDMKHLLLSCGLPPEALPGVAGD